MRKAIAAILIAVLLISALVGSMAAGLLSNDQQGSQSEHSAMQPTAPPSSDGEDDNRRRDFPPAPVWGPDAVYSEKDLEKAIQRVHYAIYCSQWTMDATTSADGGMILSLVAIGGPANGGGHVH